MPIRLLTPFILALSLACNPKIDPDADGLTVDEGDCDDSDPNIGPTAPDPLGDGVDQNCDGVDGVDGDGDGVALGEDCDDAAPDVLPGVEDLCDGVDNDCDGEIDNGPDASEYFADGDGDGFGLDGVRITACALPDGYAEQGGDCNDSNAQVNPDAVERCDGIDNDCDGVTDDSGAVGVVSWYDDVDGDGFGDAATEVEGCDGTTGQVTRAGDCDDGDAAIHPDAIEVCDGVDNDCDVGVDVDAADAVAWYTDADQDGFGDFASRELLCAPPSDGVLIAQDCNDADPAVNPLAAEVCDGADNDCDGLVDDADPSAVRPTWYADTDSDGYGDLSGAVQACTQPGGTVANAEDCDDGTDLVAPGAVEIAGDGIDQDCDGFDAGDADRDGFLPPEDCDDTDPNISPTATDIVGDLIDQNCDGVDGTDYDGDGHPSVVSGGDDCDDFEAATHPGQPERFADRIDNTCNGFVDQVPLEEADLWLLGGYADFVGGAVAVGDLTGDGADDLVIGAPGAELTPGGDPAGRVYIFEGPVAGALTPADAWATLEAEVLGNEFGSTVSLVGDVDGDGRDDLAVGVQEDDTGNSDAGAVLLWTAIAPGSSPASSATAKLFGTDSGHRVERARDVGDVDGDGLDDLLLTDFRTSRGTSYLHLGPFGGNRTVTADTSTFLGPMGLDHVQAAGGDLDGDGLADLAFGVENLGSTYEGVVYVHEAPFAAQVDIGAGSLAEVRGQFNDHLGNGIEVADLDGDGLDDLILSNWQHDARYSNEGGVWVYSGPVTGSLGLGDATGEWLGGSPADEFGMTLAVAGDVDGDGTGDLLVSQGRYRDGRAYLVLGPHTGSFLAPDDAAVTFLEVSNGNADIPWGLGAGDLNGDGIPDMAIGLPNENGTGITGAVRGVFTAF